MNPFLIAVLSSFVALGVLLASFLLGLVLRLPPRTASASRFFLQRMPVALATAVIFAWVLPWPLACVLGIISSDTGLILSLWASGPIGFVVGLWWVQRRPEAEPILPRRPITYCLIAACALAVFAIGLVLTWQAANGSIRPADRVGFWTWLQRLVGLG